jgi:hypothetical protein
MVLLLLIRYVRLVATRRRTVEISLFALAAVLVVSVALLSIKAADDAVPPAEIQFALLE